MPRYIINEPDIVAEEFDGEFVILDLAKGYYYSLLGSGNLLWSAMSAGASREAILDAIGGSGDMRGAAESFFERLLALGLIRLDHGTPTELTAAYRTAIGETADPPRLETYEDLADLLLADPIHDTDEQKGWPIRIAAET